MLRRSLTVIAASALLAAIGCAQAPVALMPQGALQEMADAPSALAAKKSYKAYYGIQHTHVAENGDDGQGTLAEAYAYARDKAKLDFLGISSHSHMITDEGYAVMKKAASAHTVNGKFVAILAQEWSSISKGGHINIFEADERCALPNGAWKEFYERWLPNHPEVGWVQFNHPHPSNPLEFGGKSFSPAAQIRASVVAQDKVAGMALLNGPGKYDGEDMKGKPDDWDRGINGLNYEEEYKDFLNRGWKIGAVADQDNHVKNWGLACETRTGVWAKGLTKAAIVDAFRDRRTFATNDHNLKLWLSINDADMGSTITAKGELTVSVAASDPDDTLATLELYGDMDGVGGAPAKLISRSTAKKSARWTLKVPAPTADGYFYAKVVYGKDKWGWTSPIWVHGK